MNNKAILIIDDENNIRVSIKRELHEWAHENHIDIVTAESGNAALQILDTSKEEIIIVVSDLKMPQMLGSDLLIEIKKKHPNILAILLTGYPDPAELMKAVSAGIHSFILKPWDHDYLVSEIDNALQQYKIKEENISLHKRIDDELKLAGELQKNVLRPAVITTPRAEFRMTFKPVEGIYCSKNYYDVISLNQTKHLVLMGDVDSFGIRSAMITTMLKAIIYPEYISGHTGNFSPSDFFDWLNHRMFKEVKGLDDIDISLFIGVLDLNEMSLFYSNAGHTHPLIFRQNEIMEIPISSQQLGHSDKTFYAMNNQKLNSGDILFFYSFGLATQNRDKKLVDIIHDVRPGNNFQQRILDKVLSSSGEKNTGKT